MKLTPLALFLVLLIGVAPAWAAPGLRANAVFKPTFLTGYASLTAGTGYVTKIRNQPVFLTAFHLFGPAGGLEQDLTPAEAVDFVAALAASSMTDPTHVAVSSDMLLIPSAKAYSDQDAGHDVAAFRLKTHEGAILEIAARSPEVGEKVYMLCRPRGEKQLRFVAATIRQVSPKLLKYVYDEAGPNFAGTSGAPVLNEAGEVVAMNLGGGTLGNREYGVGGPAAAFAKLVADALVASGDNP